MHWRVIPDIIVVCVNTEVDPSDEDWDAYLADVNAHLRGLKGVLVFTPKTGPSASQRARANAAYEKAKAEIPTAIMTSSRMVRGIMTALSWALGGKIKSFGENDFQGAVDFLALDTEEQLKAKVVLKQLARAANLQVEAFADESGQFRQKFGGG
jgi:hypothetical protein